MSTAGGYNPPVPASATADFFRTPDPTGALPDGVTDTTDPIAHNGLLGLGLGAAAAPVAALDVSRGARTGLSVLSSNSVMYITGVLPALDAFTAAGIVVTPTPSIAEIKHINQTAGIGFAYNGLYLCGTVTNSDFHMLQRGTGQYIRGWQARNGGFNYSNNCDPLVSVNGQGFVERWWNAGVNMFNVFTQGDVAGSTGAIPFLRAWQLISATGALVNAMRLRSANDGVRNTANTELWVGENQIHNRKIILFENLATAVDFFGFGINSGTLRYQVPAGSVHRWFNGAVGNVTFDTAGVIIETTTPPPAAGATDVPLLWNPTTGRVSKGPNAKRKGFAATGVTDAAGQIVFNMAAAAFTAAPVVAFGLQSPASTNLYDIKITALSATSCTIKVTKAVPVVVVLVTVLAATVNAPGETIHIVAREAGAE